MAALERLPPKPHKEMKIGKPKAIHIKTPRKHGRGAPAKQKTV
jgi:hypothetical protein